MRFAPALTLIVSAILLSGAHAAAEAPAPEKQPACPVTGDSPAVFASAVSATSFRTADGREIRLAGVIGPGEDGDTLAPSDLTVAKNTLTAQLAGRALTLAITGKPDRYRRIAAQVFSGGAWIQESMLRQGRLRVAAEQPLASCTPPLLAAEDQAIAANAGLWGDQRFRIKSPDELARRAGHFEVIEGEVYRVRMSKGAAVIEFTNASSFHLEMRPAVVREFRDMRFDVRRLRGRVIRARGWISLDDAPSMEITGPEAVQPLDKASARRR